MSVHCVAGELQFTAVAGTSPFMRTNETRGGATYVPFAVCHEPCIATTAPSEYCAGSAYVPVFVRGTNAAPIIVSYAGNSTSGMATVEQLAPATYARRFSSHFGHP